MQVNEHLKRDLRTLKSSYANAADTFEDRDRDLPDQEEAHVDEDEDEEDEEMGEPEPQALANPCWTAGRSRQSIVSAASTLMSPNPYAQDHNSTPTSPNFVGLSRPATALGPSMSPMVAPNSTDAPLASEQRDRHPSLSYSLPPLHTSPLWTASTSTSAGCSALTLPAPAPQSLQEDHQIATEALLRLHSDPRKWDDCATANAPPASNSSLGSTTDERGPRGLTIADLLSRA